MLPKATVPEGSRKVLNGVEVFTKHNFTTERGNFFETMDGDYILPNGKPVEDRSILESVPEPQREKALAWWDQRFGGGEETPPAGRKMTKAELLAKARFLMEQAEMMEDEEGPEPPDSPEPAELASEHAGESEKVKESKRSSGKSKKDEGPNVLEQMGIGS